MRALDVRPRMLRCLAAVLAAALGLGVVPPAAAAPPVRPERSVGGWAHGHPVDADGHVRLLVRHERGGAAADLAAAERGAGARGLVLADPALGLRVVAVDPAEADAVAARLRRSPGVRDVAVDVVATAARNPLAGVTTAAAPPAPLAGVATAAASPAPHVPDDRYWSYQWGPAHLEAPAAWARTTGAADVVVAVLDTGVRPDHPDLAGKLLPGANFVVRDPAGGPTAATPDEDGHGTHVAGIAAAATDNGEGVAGICWSCRILPVKVLGDDGTGLASDIIAGIRWAADQGADVINLSLGVPGSDPIFRSAVDHATARGSVVVAAAGNDGTTAQVVPAAEPNAIAVAASSPTDTRDEYSTYGPWVDVAAPGRVVSTHLAELGGYAVAAGTSMAAPHVAGALALARAQRPDLTPEQLRAALESTAVPVGGWVRAGRLDLDALLAATAAGTTWPAMPRAVTAEAGPAQGSAVVGWSPPGSTGGAPLTGYTVTADPGGGTAEVLGTATTATVTGLAPGVPHTFTVTAAGPGGTSAPSRRSAAVVPTAEDLDVPSPPGAVDAVRGDRQVAVSWSPPTSSGAGPVTGYRIVVQPEGADPTTVEVPATPTRATIPALDNGRPHTFTVAARNAAGWGEASAPSPAVTPAGVPHPPAAVAAQARDGGADLVWDPADANGAPVTGYRITVQPGGRTVDVGPTPRHVVTGLANGTSTTFTVAARNDVGLGAASPPSAAVTPAGPPSAPAPSRPAAFDGDAATTQRIGEARPAAAAVAVSRRRFDAADEAHPDARRAAHVVLSRDDHFADSLAGAPLTDRGPLLFTATTRMPAETAAEICRVLPAGGTVYLLGGKGAISDAAFGPFPCGRTYEPKRLAGPSRIETSLRVADEVRRLTPGTRPVLLARAYEAAGNPTSAWADSVTGGALGARTATPVVLTPTADLHPAVAAWLAADRPSRTVLLGGTAALSAQVERRVPAPQRVAGAERTATAQQIARQLWGAPTQGARRFAVINGFALDGWASGLAAAGLAADAGAPLLLVTPAVPAATAAMVRSCPSPQVDLLLVGSAAAIPTGTAAELDRLDGGGC